MVCVRFTICIFCEQFRSLASNVRVSKKKSEKASRGWHTSTRIHESRLFRTPKNAKKSAKCQLVVQRSCRNLQAMYHIGSGNRNRINSYQISRNNSFTANNHVPPTKDSEEKTPSQVVSCLTRGVFGDSVVVASRCSVEVVEKNGMVPEKYWMVHACPTVRVVERLRLSTVAIWNFRFRLSNGKKTSARSLCKSRTI